jgi:quercetin dioxygenase-like cupin family protein
MNNLQVFKAFENGALRLSQSEKSFIDIPWSKHPTFDGVELKHILTANDTGGIFSFHLVRIAPNKSIKNHIHETQLETHEVVSGSGICVNNGQVLNYEEGVVSIFPAGIHHEVNANSEGLYLFAKFIPALC